MKFFIENQKVEKEIEWVLNQVRLHMNGATASQMEERGIKYRINYGVGVPHLKLLADRIPVSYELAERLWFMEVRETMILAALIVPDEEMTLERCIEWSSKVNNVDIIERSAMFLWGRLATAVKCSSIWLSKETIWERALAFYTMGRMVQLKNPGADYLIGDVVGMLSIERDDLVCLKAASYLIRMLIRAGKIDNENLPQLIDRLHKTPNKNKQMLGQELHTELNFMNEA